MGTRIIKFILLIILPINTYIPKSYTQARSFYNRLKRLIQGTPKRPLRLNSKTKKNNEDTQSSQEILFKEIKTTLKKSSYSTEDRKKILQSILQKSPPRENKKETVSSPKEQPTEKTASFIEQKKEQGEIISLKREIEKDDKEQPPLEEEQLLKKTPAPIDSQWKSPFKKIKKSSDILASLAEKLTQTVSREAQKKIAKKILKTDGFETWKDQKSNNFLHLAVIHGRGSIVRELATKSPALAHQKNSAEQTPLELARSRWGEFAIHNSFENVIQPLKDQNINRSFEILKKLISESSEGPDQTLPFLDKLYQESKFKPEIIKQTDQEGNNLLHLAVIHNRYWIVNALRKKYPQLKEQKNNAQKTPIDLVQEKLDNQAPGGPFLEQMISDSLPQNPKNYKSRLYFLKKQPKKDAL